MAEGYFVETRRKYQTEELGFIETVKTPKQDTVDLGAGLFICLLLIDIKDVILTNNELMSVPVRPKSL